MNSFGTGKTTSRRTRSGLVDHEMIESIAMLAGAASGTMNRAGLMDTDTRIHSRIESRQIETIEDLRQARTSELEHLMFLAIAGMTQCIAARIIREARFS